eukprot:TRINITY_DN4627_c0_g1_i2.p1 TRINITY_DN4627_c0_g1~~TRINITY_DN4627_c0_g1_i2.p1  ORF type:complete len:580 (+),score=183.11 TRINITY_DN4627_c0_g1_i2:618-2357(+)
MPSLREGTQQHSLVLPPSSLATVSAARDLTSTAAAVGVTVAAAEEEDWQTSFANAVGIAAPSAKKPSLKLLMPTDHTAMTTTPKTMFADVAAASGNNSQQLNTPVFERQSPPSFTNSTTSTTTTTLEQQQSNAVISTPGMSSTNDFFGSDGFLTSTASDNTFFNSMHTNSFADDAIDDKIEAEWGALNFTTSPTTPPAGLMMAVDPKIVMLPPQQQAAAVMLPPQQQAAADENNLMITRTSSSETAMPDDFLHMDMEQLADSIDFEQLFAAVTDDDTFKEEPYDEAPVVLTQEANQEAGIMPTLQLPVNSTQEISLSVPVVQVPSTASYQVVASADDVPPMPITIQNMGNEDSEVMMAVDDIKSENESKPEEFVMDTLPMASMPVRNAAAARRRQPTSTRGRARGSSTRHQVISAPTVLQLTASEDGRQPAIGGTTTKRGRGRPPRSARTITPRVSRAGVIVSESDTDTATDTGLLSDDDITKMKYRRMRDLNNEASKRCRENRKLKFAALCEEGDREFKRNQELKTKLSEMEREAASLKAYIMEHVLKIPAGGVHADAQWSSMADSAADFVQLLASLQ